MPKLELCGMLNIHDGQYNTTKYEAKWECVVNRQLKGWFTGKMITEPNWEYTTHFYKDVAYTACLSVVMSMRANIIKAIKKN